MERMPVLFIGHGSPMNAIEDNEFTSEWTKLSEILPHPKAILSISAHWFTDQTRINDSAMTKMIYDMYGFPEELYQVVYQAPGAPHFAHLTKELIKQETLIDNAWGLDHGTWSVLNRLYPKADIPVFQLSIDRDTSVDQYYKIGRDLKALRDQGVLIMGSGNIVHNLSRLDWNEKDGFPWAMEFDGYIKKNILSREFDNIIEYEKAGSSASLAFRTLEHFAPLLYVLGSVDEKDNISVFNEACVMGSISMTSYLFQ